MKSKGRMSSKTRRNMNRGRKVSQGGERSRKIIRRGMSRRIGSEPRRVI